jgi:hypothetical protein
MKKQNNTQSTNKLSCCALGVAFAVTWGLAMFLLGLINMRCDWGSALLDVLSSVYIGFDFTLKGAFIGLLWGLLDGFIFGLLIALIYNFCICHCACKFCWGGKRKRRCD